MTPIARPRALVFDWDNTLVDSWECIQESYNLMFRHFAMPEWSMAETQANVAASMRDTFPAMFGDRWEEARDVFSAGFEAIHLAHLKPLPGAGEMLATLKQAGLALAVVSNKRGKFLRTEAEALGWTGLFDGLVGANDAEADKPDAAPVHMALASSGVVPGAEVWFVGDTPIDMHCAINAGCVPILLRALPPQPGEFDAHPPVRHLLDCGDLAGLVLELSVPISPI